MRCIRVPCAGISCTDKRRAGKREKHQFGACCAFSVGEPVGRRSSVANLCSCEETYTFGMMTGGSRFTNARRSCSRVAHSCRWVRLGRGLRGEAVRVWDRTCAGSTRSKHQIGPAVGSAPAAEVQLPSARSRSGSRSRGAAPDPGQAADVAALLCETLRMAAPTTRRRAEKPPGALLSCASGCLPATDSRAVLVRCGAPRGRGGYGGGGMQGARLAGALPAAGSSLQRRTLRTLWGRFGCAQNAACTIGAPP